MKKVLLLWYTEGKNFGDMLIYQTVKDYLLEQQLKCDYIDVGLPCHEIFEKANNYDFLLFAGGGILERYVPNIVKHFEDDFEELHVPYGIVGVSIGKFDYSQYYDGIRSWVNNATFFYTRDQFSADKLNEICKKNKAIANVDVVWANRNIYKTNDMNLGKIGINIRDAPYQDLTSNIDLKVMNRIVQQNNISIFIPDQSQFFKEDFNMNQYSVSEVIQQISKCNLIVAMRYHVILVAAIMGIPSVPVVYCNKVHELSCQIDLTDYEVDISQFEKIDCKVNEITENYDKIKKQMILKVKLMQRCAKKMLYDIIEIIKMN